MRTDKGLNINPNRYSAYTPKFEIFSTMHHSDDWVSYLILVFLRAREIDNLNGRELDMLTITTMELGYD